MKVQRFTTEQNNKNSDGSKLLLQTNHQNRVTSPLSLFMCLGIFCLIKVLFAHAGAFCFYVEAETSPSEQEPLLLTLLLLELLLSKLRLSLSKTR